MWKIISWCYTLTNSAIKVDVHICRHAGAKYALMLTCWWETQSMLWSSNSSSANSKQPAVRHDWPLYLCELLTSAKKCLRKDNVFLLVSGKYKRNKRNKTEHQLHDLYVVTAPCCQPNHCCSFLPSNVPLCVLLWVHAFRFENVTLLLSSDKQSPVKLLSQSGADPSKTGSKIFINLNSVS